MTMMGSLHAIASSSTTVLSSVFARRPRPTPPADVLAIANAVLDEVESIGGVAGLIRVQRLTILAQLWSIALLKRPMYRDGMTVLAGRPALSAIHRAFRSAGTGPIVGRARIPEIPQFDWPSDTDAERLEIVRSVVRAYGGFDDYRLGQILTALLGDEEEHSLVDQKAAASRLLAKAPA